MEKQDKTGNELEAAVTDFCSFFGYPEIQDDLWYCVTTALSRDGTAYDEAEARGDLLFLYEKVEQLFEAIYRWDARVKNNDQLKSTTDGKDNG